MTTFFCFSILKFAKNKSIDLQKMVKQSTVTKPYIQKAGSRLSEGCTYVPENNSLVWIDVIEGKLHRAFLKDEIDGSIPESKVETITVDSRIGVIGLTSSPDVFIAGVLNGIGLASFKDGSFTPVKDYPENLHSKDVAGYIMRSNDGSVDSEGNFWVGTMCDFVNGGVHPVGHLYRFDSKTSEFESIIPEVTIPNGLNWYDGYMYFTDSLQHKIFKIKHDVKTNTLDLESKEVFVDIAKIFKDHPNNEELVLGEPDGSCMDLEGNLYIAVWGTNRVLKIDIKGNLVEEIYLPAKRVTCVTIGGPEFDELYITTADLHLDDINLLGTEKGDLGGALFKVKLDDGLRGSPQNKWNNPLA